MFILQVSTYDTRGGAAQVAWNLHQAYRQRGLESWMAVGKKLSDDPNVLIIPNEQTKSLLTRALLRLALSLRQLNGYIWGMRYIAALRSLRFVAVGHTQVGDAGLRHEAESQVLPHRRRGPGKAAAQVYTRPLAGEPADERSRTQ